MPRTCQLNSAKPEGEILGGIGSGRRYQGGRDTTNDYRAWDVRWLLKNGLLTPGRSGTTSWSRNDNRIACIQVRAESDRMALNYRSRSNGGDWQAIEYPVYLEWTDCHLGGAHGFDAQQQIAGGARRFCMAGRSSLVFTATVQRMRASAKQAMTRWRDVRTDSATNSAGSRASCTATASNPRACTGEPSSG